MGQTSLGKGKKKNILGKLRQQSSSGLRWCKKRFGLSIWENFFVERVVEHRSRGVVVVVSPTPGAFQRYEDVALRDTIW